MLTGARSALHQGSGWRKSELSPRVLKASEQLRWKDEETGRKLLGLSADRESLPQGRELGMAGPWSRVRACG